MIQIRNVPDALHRQLKSRAALAGMSLSDYLLSEIRRLASTARVGGCDLGQQPRRIVERQDDDRGAESDLFRNRGTVGDQH
jgi:plasmid stability protein